MTVEMRYGMNPHQAARIAASPGPDPVEVRNGGASYINLLDALNAWQLVRDASAATGAPVAASFKHVSPAGVATSGAVDDAMQEAWGLSGSVGPITSAYVRARDVDPKSSFGDMIAVSEPVDTELAEFLSRVVADGIVAPGFEPGTLEVLAAKKKGSFLVLEADPAYEPPDWEFREVFGMVLEQERDVAPITGDLLHVVGGGALTTEVMRDSLLGLATLRYTQSNSVALVRDGIALGIGAGQQNRVDCVKLAGNKAAVWWLRRNDIVRSLPRPDGMSRQDWLNWQIRVAEGDMTPGQRAEFGTAFPEVDLEPLGAWRKQWVETLRGVTLASDGFLPFRDNVDHASRYGVETIVDPGGSSRSDDVEAASREHDITLVRTGLRLFHH